MVEFEKSGERQFTVVTAEGTNEARPKNREGYKLKLIAFYVLSIFICVSVLI